MKMQDALDIIYERPKGYMVSFERCGDGFLKSDHFPDKHAGEDLIPTETEAWIIAKKFAAKMRGRVCNLYVVDSNFSPVTNYIDKQISNR